MWLEMKPIIKNISRIEPQKLGLASFAAFLLISLALFAVSTSNSPSIPLPTTNLRTRNDYTISTKTNKNGPLRSSGLKNETQEQEKMSDKMDVNDSKQDKKNSKQLGEELKKSNANPEHKQVCDLSDPRTDVCEMEGDIRINGASSTILFPSSSQTNTTQSWTIKAHPRKGDTHILSKITKITVKPHTNTLPPPPCTVNHTVPAVVLSTGGYMGNAFHDFTDVLIPLFITSHQFNGEVQFLVTEIRPEWNIKYKPILQHLSHYKILDFNKDREVHCYPRVIVGLKSHKEMTIDPSRSCYTMLDFGRLIRTSFNLPREVAYGKLSALPSPEMLTQKPRLLIIARRWSRSFKNVDDIVRLGEQLGFEVVVAEAKPGDLAQFASIVNSCDVMMGVHGAGLTNLVFLPANAAVIQVVPLGKLEGIASSDFGVPTVDLGMKYLQYSISEEESTLLDLYSREDAVFRDPVSVHRKGWLVVRDVYLVKQNVRLDVGRFRGTLLQALELLKS